MSAVVSPLDLVLDTENPRFIILGNREQADIRKYLVTYEDVCELATGINEYGGLLPGERIVVLQEEDRYVVVEGNRRTCSLQLLLSRDLIPDGFVHRIPPTSESVIRNCSRIEVDILPNRNAAIELMSKRHIEGVKQWKPLAKKQFFAAHYRDGHGQSVYELSQITGIRQSEIRSDICDYKFFYKIYGKYTALHPDFDKELIILKTDPFWRIFKASFEYPAGNKTSPRDFFCISYSDTLDLICGIDMALFEQIAILVFEKAVVQEEITTRDVLTSVNGILPLLQAVLKKRETPSETTESNNKNETQEPPAGNSTDSTHPSQVESSRAPTTSSSTSDSDSNGEPADRSTTPENGQTSGGPSPRTFFEALSWHGKLDPANREHQGMLFAINELYRLSCIYAGRQRAYKAFPIATGMVLRTAYEQSLRFRLKQVNLWGSYLDSLGSGSKYPTLKTMEDFIGLGTNKNIVLPQHDMVLAFDQVIAASHREFLNGNIHYPGNISVTAESLEAMAARGMYSLLQSIINLAN